MPTIDKNRSGSETSLFQYISSKTKCWVILKIMWFVKWMKMEQDSGAVPFAREVSRTRARLIVTSKANIFKPTHTLASFVPISFQPDVPCKGTQLLCTDKHLCLFQSDGMNLNNQSDGIGFVCLGWQKVVLHKGNLKKHIVSMHISESPQECQLCGKSFKNLFLNSFPITWH